MREFLSEPLVPTDWFDSADLHFGNLAEGVGRAAESYKLYYGWYSC